MTDQVRLVLVIHIHQPIGNFEGVCEDAWRDSYAPFIEVMREYPGLPFGLHISGSLLEWLAAAHPEYIDRVREMVERNQVEIIGGPFYEPILAGIPRRDRIGQIVAYSQYLERTFGGPVRGMWVPERVWEQSFTSDICEAGIEYTVLDDFHFRNAGLSGEKLHGYFLTEDEGRLLKLFPGSERLRYTIPFQDPQKTIEYLGEVAGRAPHSIVTFGDDGEKFGTWPGTNKHVYEDGWLRRFLDALRANAEWIKVTTPGEAVDHVSPRGTIFLPDSSYREMTEWAFPVERQAEYQELVERKKHDHDWPQIRSFIRGGFWRNFRVKYPEADEMYARMLHISSRLEKATRERDSGKGQESRGQGQAPPGPRPSASGDELLAAARTELYRAQCNCSYWHGAFGGLYLPHLRNAVYRHLISADSLLEKLSGRSGRWVEIDAADYDLDARKEVRLAGERLAAFLAPARGGHLYELDVRSTPLNLLATLNRRPEVYHQTVREAAGAQRDGDGHVASIHDSVNFKQPDLDKKLVYDNWPRKSLVDHFLRPGCTLESFAAGDGHEADFHQGVYDAKLRRSLERVEAVLSRRGFVGPHEISVTKTIALDSARGGTLSVRYDLEDLPPGAPLHFGVEFNFAALAAGQPDRYFYDETGRQLDRLGTAREFEPTGRIGLIDEWLGLDAAVETSRPTGFWTFPIQTVSQSEGGFELVHQSTVLIPHWEFAADDDGRWNVELTLSIDTSAAQARQLGEAAATAAEPAAAGGARR